MNSKVKNNLLSIHSICILLERKNNNFIKNNQASFEFDLSIVLIRHYHPIEFAFVKIS